MYREERPKRKTFPVNAIVDGGVVLVVGGGQVGRRKVRQLLESGAEVEIVCPDAVEEISSWAGEGRIRWTRRPFRAGDVAGHLLVFACTDDKHLAEIEAKTKAKTEDKAEKEEKAEKTEKAE